MDGKTNTMIYQYDKNIIEQYIKEGWLIRKWHPTLPLQILNYSRATEYSGKWDDITKNCRGLVLDDNYKVVSPCMPKFFNFYQHQTEDQKIIEEKMKHGFYNIMAKYDGCLGSVFEYNGEIVCASKGSFDSFVTKEMYKMIDGKLFINDFETVKSNLIVEVIHPNTHILCNYGDTKEFRVITSFRCDRKNNDYFEWSYEDTLNIIHNMDPNQELLKPIESYNMTFEQLREWQKKHNDKLTEGFVVRFLDDSDSKIQRVKFKSEEYLSIAAVKSNADPIHICNNALELFKDRKNWPKYENGKWLDYLYAQVKEIPEDELRDKAFNICTNLWVKTEFIYDKFFMIAQKYKDLSDKELGMKAKEDSELKKNLNYIFNIRHDKPFDRVLIEMAKQEFIEFESLPEEEKERIRQEKEIKLEKHKQKLDEWRKSQC